VPVQYSYTSTPLSTCTVQLYLYSPQYLYSTAIPLLPSVPVPYSYTSTLLMGRTTCTEPQCLYKGALYLTYIYLIIFLTPYIIDPSSALELLRLPGRDSFTLKT